MEISRNFNLSCSSPDHDLLCCYRRLGHKYAVVYLTGQTAAAAQDNYFTSFITSPVSPVLFALLFMGVTAFIVYNGVEGGIERVSRCMMPILLVLVVVIAGYSLTLHHVDESGQMRTGMDGLLYYITPHFEGLTFSLLPSDLT